MLLLMRKKLLTFKGGTTASHSPSMKFQTIEGNGLAEVEEGDSKDTLACDDDAHKVDVCN